MKTGAFASGVVLGFLAHCLLKKNNQQNCKDKIASLLNEGKSKMMHNMSSSMHHCDMHKEQHNDHSSHVTSISPEEKQKNMNVLKQFIANHPEVKREVEKILKESNTSF